ncbi:MAG: hypothetical protein EZS28_038494 [Streblomastix strix]|uniref:MULE transposase domain-containing protein n=1 Tax=Streblomastix strix TaxID=222440 RepID=A0A5J4U6I8_9EUKA|nr:MAG: hypothetical protein EZS28_038494 [Streblomastix strix]
MPIAGINEDEEYIDQDLLFDMYLDFMCSCRLAFKSGTSKKFQDFWRASIRLARLQPDTPIEQILQKYNRQQISEKIRLKCNGLILNMLEPMQDQYCSIQIDTAKILSYHVAIAVIVFPFLGTKPFVLTSYIGSVRKVNYLDFGVRLFNLLQGRGISFASITTDSMKSQLDSYYLNTDDNISHYIFLRPIPFGAPCADHLISHNICRNSQREDST